MNSMKTITLVLLLVAAYRSFRTGLRPTITSLLDHIAMAILMVALIYQL